MSYLLAAQSSVDWQQRGIITSSVSFFRTMGGAVGIGLLGAAFNFLSRGDLSKLEAEGVSPAAALDPHLQANRYCTAALILIRHAISSGLIWVFGAMLVCAITAVFHDATDEGRQTGAVFVQVGNASAQRAGMIMACSGDACVAVAVQRQVFARLP